MADRQETEQQSKDRYFEELEVIAKRMIEAHGKDFAMGALVLAARWIAEDRLKKAESVN
jgi:hypothetical protein